MEVQTGGNEEELAGHRGPVRTVAYSRDGKTLLTTSLDLTGRLWDLKSGKTVEQMQKDNLLAPYSAWNGEFVKADQFIAVVARDLQAKK